MANLILPYGVRRCLHWLIIGFRGKKAGFSPLLGTLVFSFIGFLIDILGNTFTCIELLLMALVNVLNDPLAVYHFIQPSDQAIWSL